MNKTDIFAILRGRGGDGGGIGSAGDNGQNKTVTGEEIFKLVTRHRLPPLTVDDIRMIFCSLNRTDKIDSSAH